MQENLRPTHFYFFIVYPLGLENLGLKEFQEKWSLLFQGPSPLLKREKGGLELKVENLWQIELLSLYLKLPTRILLRIASPFTVRDFPKLYLKIKKLPFKNLFLMEVPKMMKCTSKESRLINTKTIEETIKSALNDYFKHNPPKKKDFEKSKKYLPPVLHARIIKDQCLLSIDVTGGHLYMRGQREWVGKAPLRENLAAAFVYFSNNHQKKSICDPMCGSASLLIESLSFYKPIQRSQLSFLTMPLLLRNNHQLLKIKELGEQEKKTYGFDICSKALRAAKKNDPLSEFKENNLWEDWPINEKVDSIILNPPWNRRLKLEHNKSYLDLFNRLKEKTSSLSLILPRETSFEKFSKRPSKIIHTESGGIKIQFVSWGLHK